MDLRPPYTRREFLHTGVAVISTIATIPTFLQHSGQVLAAQRDGALVQSRPGSPDERILVVIQLSGGNDGLNAVVPYGERAYYNARPRLAVQEDKLIKVDQDKGIGLHPNMAAFKELIDQGVASAVLGVGYPNPNRSHFASMDIWHSGDTRSARTGWIGRALDQYKLQKRGRIDASACVCIGPEAPLATLGKYVRPVSFARADMYQWTGGRHDRKLAKGYDTINRAGVLNGPATADADSQAAFVMRTALDAQISSDRIRAAMAKRTQTKFPGGNALSNQLRMVAQMIRAELPTRVYYVALGGFDHHANQAWPHARLLRMFSEAVRAFHRELKSIGQSGRVLTMAFSEFGRRVAQNASGGTDHGCAGPMFLVGDMVKPGLIGTYPSLTELDRGDLIHNLDFRSVYAAALDQWMKISSVATLNGQWQHAEVLDPKRIR